MLYSWLGRQESVAVDHPCCVVWRENPGSHAKPHPDSGSPFFVPMLFLGLLQDLGDSGEEKLCQGREDAY